MDRCELCEIEISALLDGESTDEAMLPALDHLVACARCRDFYQRARQLEGAVATLRTPLAGAPPPELWQEIERASGLAPRRALPRWPARLAQVAAAVLLVFGLWAAAGAPDRRNEKSATLEVMLGQDPDRMSDERFARLVVDLLSADRRYHRKMLEVMTAVEELSSKSESPEPIRPTFTSHDLEEPESTPSRSWTF